MREERPDPSLFIGLHKLAEQNGEGLVPELYYYLLAEGAKPDMTNVVTFPIDRRNITSDAVPDAPGRILAFRR